MSTASLQREDVLRHCTHLKYIQNSRFIPFTVVLTLAYHNSS